MPTIFRKTAKGVAEIETRANKLPPRIRSTLILVDGKRSIDDLRALVSVQIDETLSALITQGFIEDLGEPLRVPKPGSPPSGGAAPAQPAPTIESLRRLVVRALNDELGPAAESMAIRVEKTRSIDELRPLIAQAVQLVQSARGQAAADLFATRLPTF